MAFLSNLYKSGVEKFSSGCSCISTYTETLFKGKVQDGIPTDSNSMVQYYYWKISSKVKPSEFVYHHCIRVFEKFYEYTPQGIQITGRPRKTFEEAVKIGRTDLTVQDFEEWVNIQNDEYSQEKFNLESHNSFTFIVKCCEILDIPTPKPTEGEMPPKTDLKQFLTGYCMQLQSFSVSSLFRSY